MTAGAFDRFSPGADAGRHRHHAAERPEMGSCVQAEASAGAGPKVRTVDLLDLVKHLQESLFTSIVDIQPGLLFVLFFW
jgi:hypothetical protein